VPVTRFSSIVQSSLSSLQSVQVIKISAATVMFSTPIKSNNNAAFRTPSPSKYNQAPLTPRQHQAVVSHLRHKSPQTKSSIYRSTPLRIDLQPSDYTLTGTTQYTVPALLASPSTRKPAKKSSKPSLHNDRFIPNRSASSHESARINYQAPSMPTGFHTDEDTASTAHAYAQSVAEACGIALNQRILAFKPSAPQSDKPVDLRAQYNRPLKSVAGAAAHASTQAQFRRRILTAPERVLDAPGLVDDYYLNLLDWSVSNQVAIGLERAVYVWNADSGTVAKLVETPPHTSITSLKWSGDGSFLALGQDDGDVQIWDCEAGVKVRSMPGHDSRVAVLAWDKHILSSGSRDTSIFNHDVRERNHKVAELLGHTGEICGLEWRSDGAQLASGGNDNLVNIWDARSSVPKFTKSNHRAAVKAIAWCPWQTNLLATGGGSSDKHIHFWNGTTGARLNSIDTGSQVTSLKWSTGYKEIVSCHGFPDNHLSVWHYPSLVKQVDIPAHDSRVLYSTLSPDGQVLATAASDENLKFWRVFEQSGDKKRRGQQDLMDMGKMRIR
jgi:cell division cycle 20, cofactor of APC complex